MNIELSFTNGISRQKSLGQYFITDEGIQGCIRIRNLSRRKFDLVKISLEGLLLNSITFGEWISDSRKFQVLLRMSDVKKRSDFVRVPDSEGSYLKSTFHFHIPQCLGQNLLGEDSEYLSDLPPTLSCAGEFKDGVNPSQCRIARSRIVYTIRADVIHDETTIGTMMKPIQLIPALKPRPPICMSDFGEEYINRCTKPLRGTGRRSLNKIGSLSMDAMQPEPVVIKDINDSVTINIPLKLRFRSNDSDDQASRRSKRDQDQFNQALQSILQADADCVGFLVSSTYVSLVPRQEVPTIEGARTSLDLTSTSSVLSKADNSINFPSTWTRDPNSECFYIDTTMTLNFDEFKNDDLLQPSFDSSLVSHRYRLALSIQLSASHRVSFQLTVPVSITYSSHKSDQPPSFDEIYPDLTSSTHVVENLNTPAASNEDLTRQLAALSIRDLLHENEQALHQQGLDLPLYHPRAVGIAAPPYVM